MAAKLFSPFAALALLASVVLGSTSPASKPFQNVTRHAGVGNSGSGNGAVWIDYDNDHDLDLYVVNDPGSGAFYRNKGDGTFENVSAGLTLNGADPETADYNRDGYVDVVVGNAGNAKLYRNTGGGTFVDETASSGISVGVSVFPVWGDYNRDGRPDLYFGEAGRLFRNNGDGTFTDTTSSAFASAPPGRCHPAWIDYDRDGYDDLFLAPVNGDFVLYRSKGNGTFEDVSAQATIKLRSKDCRLAIGDYNGDKYPDIYVFRGGSKNLLFRNNKDGTFSEVAHLAGVCETSDKGMSDVAFFDYDGDGDLDLFANGGRYGSNNFFRNDGEKFTDITAFTGLSNTDDTHDIAIGDYNGDGSPDIYEVNFTGYGSSVNKLFRNTCVFEPQRETTPFIARMHVPHDNGGVVACEGRLYVWSGYTAPGRPHYDRTPVLEVYDPATNTWTRKADVPGARNGIGQFVLNGMIYSVGGEESPSGSFTNTVYRYDPNKDTWTTMKPFPTDIWHPQSAVCAGKAYIVGGRQGYGCTYPYVYEYDERTDAWIRKADMPCSVTSGACVACENRIYVFGGNHKTGEPGNEYVDKIQIYDPSTDSWSYGGEIPWKLASPRVVKYKDDVHLFAAKVWDPHSGDWVDNEHICKFSPASGKWSRTGFVPPVKTGGGSQLAIIDGNVYFTEIFENGRRANKAYSIDLGSLSPHPGHTSPDVPQTQPVNTGEHPTPAKDEQENGREPLCLNSDFLAGIITGFATGVALCAALLVAALAGFALGKGRKQ